MTSIGRHGIGREPHQEEVAPESSGNSTSKVMVKEESDEDGCPKAAGSKRILSTVDPDYAHHPDTKRMRKMHQRAQDELSERVIKVVDKELHKAIMEKEAEMEEIDAQILKLQQCLHTLRYCVSLSYYNIEKGEVQTKEIRDRKLSGLHPAIQRHLGKAPSIQQQTSETLRIYHTSQNKTPSTNQIGKELTKESQSSSQKAATTRAPSPPIADTGTTSTQSLPESSVLPSTSSHYIDETQIDVAKEASSSRPPSPKHLPPLPPDNTATISQGRQQRFQSKRRLIVGNTYQYLAPLPGEESTDFFKYKWQLYVRAPPNDPDTSSFLQSVTFILDNSYAPHHIITIKQPPFVLSRRGWGEFKVRLTLRFIDQRNKPVQLLHPLVLSRPNDALALTGLWRLGQENWYDLWIYLPNPETNSDIDGCTQVKEEEFCPATLTQELKAGVISSQVEENITVNHIPASGIDLTSELLSKEDCAESNDDENEKSTTIRVRNPILDCPLSETDMKDEEKSAKVETERADKEQAIVNDKMCTVYMRQADGTLKPYQIPSHVYPLAMQMAKNHIKECEPSSSFAANNRLTQEAKLSHDSRKQNRKEGNKVQCKKTQEPNTLKLLSLRGTSSNMLNETVIRKTPERTIHLKEAGGNHTNLRVVPVQAATNTATTTCPNHILLQIGIKEKKLASLHKQHSSQLVKHSSTSDTLHLSQVQKIISPQISSYKSLASENNATEVPVTISSQGVHQNHTLVSNVKYITSNGQLLTAEKLKSLGLQVHTNTGKCSSLTPSNTIGSTAPTASTSSPITGPLLIQGGKVVNGTHTLQLITNQGKIAVKPYSRLSGLCNDKTSNIPMQSLIPCNEGNLVALISSNGLVEGSPNKIKVETSDGMEVFKSKNSSHLWRIVSRTGPKTDCSSKKNQIGSDDKEHQLNKKQEESSSSWEDYMSWTCAACKSITSSAVCVSLWLKVLTLVHPSHMPPSPFTFCWATSYQHFLSWPLAKQRACEFQRAREVRRWLKECHVKGWERWTVPRIVSWARSHAYTPVPRRPVLRTDKLQQAARDPGCGKSLSYVGDLDELEQQEHGTDTTCTPDSPVVDVVGLEEEEPQGDSKRIQRSPVKKQLNYLQWEDPEMIGACEWVGLLTSQLRLSLHAEEVAEGFMADAARATLWKATMGLMEDLLRTAHHEAWSEGIAVPPLVITLPNVLAALTSSRPEFDLFSDHGLGTPNEYI